MPASTKKPAWVLRLRSACPKGWSVRNMRGKVYLRVTEGSAGADAACVTLPIVWAADTVPETVQLITELHQMVGEGVIPLSSPHDQTASISTPPAGKTPVMAETG